MSKKKREARQALKAASDLLSDEIWNGRWDHLTPPLGGRLISQWTEIFDEMQRRCPGHTREEYEDAMLRSHFMRR